MRQKRQGFQFLGFVALADTLFAVSAGLLLLNPIRFGTTSAAAPPTPKVEAQPVRMQPIIIEIQKLEKRLEQLEADGRRIQRQAAEVLRNE
jgi:hypothetical protein